MSREQAERLFPSTPPPSDQKDRREAWDRMQLQLFYSVLNGIAEGVVVVLPDGVITFFNAAAKEMFGLTDADVQYRNLFHDLFTKADGETENALEQRFLAEGRVLRERTMIQHPSGKEMRIELTLMPSVIGDIQARVVVTCRDVTLEEAQRRELEERALNDHLTRCLNRHAFEAELERLAQPCRGDIGVLFLDLDRFKKVNDAHGESAGDAVILQAANIMRRCVRSSDLLIRYGGDEFLVILNGVGERSALRVAENILQAMRAADFPIIGTRGTYKLTVSIGVAVMPRARYTQAQLIARAEVAKRKAKIGKDRVILFTPNMVSR